MERTLFMLEWMLSIAKASFATELSENQRYRASGLNLVDLAIILWNTVYLERAINALTQRGITFPDALPPHVPPIGWAHINLTGDYTWQSNRRVAQGPPLGVPTTVDGALL
jgi:hypothetical protein